MCALRDLITISRSYLPHLAPSMNFFIHISSQLSSSRDSKGGFSRCFPAHVVAYLIWILLFSVHVFWCDSDPRPLTSNHFLCAAFLRSSLLALYKSWVLFVTRQSFPNDQMEHFRDDSRKCLMQINSYRMLIFCPQRCFNQISFEKGGKNEPVLLGNPCGFRFEREREQSWRY